LFFLFICGAKYYCDKIKKKGDMNEKAAGVLYST